MSEPSSNAGPDRTAIWAVVVLTCVTLVVIGTLAALGRPLSEVTNLVVLLVPTTVGSLLTLMRVEKMATSVETVRVQTNGNMTKLLDKIPQGNPDAPKEE